MKGKLNKCLSVFIASALGLSSVISMHTAAFAADNWIKGWTGSADSSDFSFNNESSSSVEIENSKVNNGKFTDEEDSVIYYAQQLDPQTDFELKAKLSIEEYSYAEDASNPNQSSVGLAVLDEVFNKTDDKKFTNAVFLGTYAQDKNSSLNFRTMLRDNSDTKKISDKKLSEDIPNSGADLGVFDLSIKKSGNVYTLTCGEESESIEMTGFSDTIFPCLYIARNVKAAFSDIELNIENRKITELKVEGDYKKSFTYGEEFDLGDAKLSAVYDDGSVEYIDDYAVKGYDANKVGQQNVSLVKGSAEANLSVSVSAVKCEKLVVEYEPAKTQYYKGTAFKSDALQIRAYYENGKSEILEPSQYSLYIDDQPVKDGDILNKSGKLSVKAVKNEETGISGGAAVKFNINVSEDYLTGLSVVKEPEKTIYYIGDKFDDTGIRICADYSDGQTELLKKSEYTVSELDTSEPGEKTLSISYNKSKVVPAQLTVNVNERQPEGIKITSYPRTTYDVGADFSDENMVVAIEYDNGDLEPIENYSIDKSGFDSSAPGKTSVLIIPEDSSFESIELPISIVEQQKHIWRKAIFGQSASVEKEDTGSAGVSADNYGTVEGKVNVKAWDATGKMTADHDGIVYYYTRVSGDKNFTLSADITVNKYLEHDNDDTKRNGQEAFGIMARDVVPLVDENGNMTIDYSSAKKDEDGAAVTQEKSAVFASNVAVAGGYSGTGWPTDPTSASYEKNTMLNRINLYARKGVEATDGGGTKVGPNALSETFPKEGNKYKITMQRVNGGVYAKCYDYSNSQTGESFIPEDDLFTIQNSNDIYVGFFAARWADFDAENIEFYESERETDPQMNSDDGAEKTPSLLIRSSKYSKTKDYRLEIEPLESTGSLTVMVNGKVAARDVELLKGSNYIDLKLAENAKNVITAVYTPDDRLNLTSYDDIILRQDVYHKNFDTSVQNVYVSPEGSFNASGTEAEPYDIDTAVGFLAEGQTVIMKGGTYKRSEPIVVELGNNGTAGKMKTVMAQPGEKVIFDMQKISAGAEVTGNYWHFKDLEFINTGDNLKGFHLGGSNCIVENCVFRDNGDIGLQISRTYVVEDRNLWPSNNLILNCEAYNNCDPAMINADGFGAKLTVGEGNIFRNCKSHHNLDDGWDLYTKVNSGPIGAVTLENCMAYKNGYKLLEDGSEVSYNAGGNNGFKLGGENVAVKHILKNCIAYKNGANGITTNSNPALELHNVVSVYNENANFRLYSDKPAEYNYTADGCVSYVCGENESDVFGTVNRDEDYTNNSGTALMNESNYFITEIGGESHNLNGESMTADGVKKKLDEVCSEGNIDLTGHDIMQKNVYEDPESIAFDKELEEGNLELLAEGEYKFKIDNPQ